MFLKINKAFYQWPSKFNKTTKCSATFTCYNIFPYSLLKAQPFFYSYQTHASCCVSNQGWNRSVGQTSINFNVSKTRSQGLYLLCDFRCKSLCNTIFSTVPVGRKELVLERSKARTYMYTYCALGDRSRRTERL